MKALNKTMGGTGIFLKIFAVGIALFLIFILIVWVNIITQNDFFDIFPNYPSMGKDDYFFGFTAMLVTCIVVLSKILMHLDRQK